MQVHHKNFGSKTALRCGFRAERYIYPEHIHQFPEIIYVTDGEMEITVEGNKEIMQKGDIAIVAPFRAHSFYTEEHVERWVCVFSNDFVSNFLSDEDFFSVRETCVFHASDRLIGYINGYLPDSEELFFELTEENIRSFRTMIFAIYEEYLRTVRSTKKKTQNKALSAILFYISEHYTEDISLSSIGAALGYSPKYVSLCLSDIDEMNLSTLVNSFRIDHAKNLLSGTPYKMVDIAIECGFSNERSFYRTFAQLTGETPGDYRKSKRTISTQENEAMPYPELYEEKRSKKQKAKQKNTKRSSC